LGPEGEGPLCAEDGGWVVDWFNWGKRVEILRGGEEIVEGSLEGCE